MAAETTSEAGRQYIPASSVDDYQSASRNHDPLLYPGTRPDTSYVTDGTNVYTLHTVCEGSNLHLGIDSASGVVDADDFLREHNAAPLKDRIPVLAFGANMCPGSLAAKFEKVGRPDALIILTVYGTLKGYDVVWSGVPSLNGNFSANLYRGPETESTEVQVGINFLTPEQLLVMHATELNYDLAVIDVGAAEGSLRAYYYVGKDSVHLQAGKPVAIEGIPASGRVLATATTVEMLDDMLSAPDILEPLYADHPSLRDVHTAAEYIAYIRSFEEKGAQKWLDLEQRLNALSIRSGRAKVTETDIDPASWADWANPSKLLTYGQLVSGVVHSDLYRLPSQEIPPGSWADPAARTRVLESMAAHMVRTSGGALRFKAPDSKQS